MHIVSPKISHLNSRCFFVKLHKNDLKEITKIMNQMNEHRSDSINITKSDYCELKLKYSRCYRYCPPNKTAKCHLIFPKALMTVNRRSYHFKTKDIQIVETGNIERMKPYHRRRYLYKIECHSISICHKFISRINQYNKIYSTSKQKTWITLIPYQCVIQNAAAVTIQSAFKSYYARSRLLPPLVNTILSNRGAILLQRWWRNQIFRNE